MEKFCKICGRYFLPDFEGKDREICYLCELGQELKKKKELKIDENSSLSEESIDYLKSFATRKIKLKTCYGCGKVIKRFGNDNLEVFVNIRFLNTKVMMFPPFEKELCQDCLLDKDKINKTFNDYLYVVNHIPKMPKNAKDKIENPRYTTETGVYNAVCDFKRENNISGGEKAVFQALLKLSPEYRWDLYKALYKLIDKFLF